jgi:hypothetical protein
MCVERIPLASRSGKNVANGLRLRVESGGRFIHDEERGIADQRLCDTEALLHPAGESADGATRRLMIHLFEHCITRFFEFTLLVRRSR